jgi:hypothetical protein
LTQLRLVVHRYAATIGVLRKIIRPGRPICYVLYNIKNAGTYPLNKSHDLGLGNLNGVVISYYLNNPFLRFRNNVSLGHKELGVAPLCDALKILAALANNEADIFIRDAKFVQISIERVGVTHMEEGV